MTDEESNDLFDRVNEAWVRWQAWLHTAHHRRRVSHGPELDAAYARFETAARCWMRCLRTKRREPAPADAFRTAATELVAVVAKYCN
jgi:hypothetical protein